MEQKYCDYCETFFTGELINHLRCCDKYLDHIDELISMLTYEFLYNEYIVKEKSISQISKEVGFKKNRQVHKKLLEYKIPIRNAHENRFAKGYIEQTKTTCLEKYGCEYHTLKESPIRQKIWAGVKEKYGVDNIFQLPEVIEKIKKTNLKKYGVENASQSKEIRQKVKDTCLERYGVDNVRKSQEFINKMKATKASKPTAYAHTSKISQDFFSLLYDKLTPSDHIYFQPKSKEFTVMSKDNVLYCYDFVDSINMVCIEFNGDYWHGNPNLYESDWVNPHNGLTSKEMQVKDKVKIKSIKERGYRVLVIWESDFRKNSDKVINKCVKFIKN